MDDRVDSKRSNGAFYRQQGWWRDETVIDDLRRAIQNHPDKTAIVAARRFARELVQLSYAELGVYVDRFAGALLELGAGRSQVVAVQLPNWWQFTPLALACARIGAIIAPIPPDYRRREVEFILRRTEASLYIGPAVWAEFSHREMLRELASTLPTLRRRVFIGVEGDLDGGELDFDDWFIARKWEERHTPAELDRLGARPDDIFNILYTSGTTGEPKGVLHSHNTNYAITRALADTMLLRADDVVSLPSILTASSGFTYLFLMPLLLGQTAVYLDVADPDFHLDLIEAHGVTFMYGLPTYFLNAIAAQRRRPRKVSSLKRIATGSIPVPPHLITEVRNVFGVPLHTLWGMTENGAVTITRDDDPPDWPANSDGRPVPWMETKIVPAFSEDGTPFPDGVGRLMVRGASQCLGYFKRDDLYAACVDPEGWFDTGDLARDDGRGGIRIVGRLKDMIFRHGSKIPVVEVESALYSHPKVREVAIVGHSDDRIGGERVCAVVLPRDSAPTLDELRQHLRALGMSMSYWPDRLEIVEEMPKTPSGKIRKYLLRERLKQTPAKRSKGLEPGPESKPKRKHAPLVPRARGGSLPLSFAQQRLWFLAQMAPDDVSYNVPYFLRLKGQLDVAALERTLSALVQRHEVLRTTFAEVEGKPAQQIAAALSVALPLERLEALPDPASAIESRAIAEARRPFDLRTGPLLRTTLLRVAPDEHVLLLVMHHIVCDGWSMGVLVRDLRALYEAFARGVEPALPALPIQYADYASWQRDWLKDEVLEEQLAWWRHELAGAPPVLALPSDRPRAAVRTNAGNRYTMRLSAELSDAVRELSRVQGVTPYMTLLAAFYAFLFRCTGQSDIVVGSPISGRNRREVEGLIGFFVNTMVLRMQMSAETSFRELLDRVRRTCMGAYAHQDVPFERLVDALQPARDLTTTPLFQVMFALQNAPAAALELPGLTLEVLDVPLGTSIFDLLLELHETPDGLIACWHYRTDLFEESTVARMAEHYARLLEGAVAQPETQLREMLPEYVLPSTFVPHQDQSALPAPDTQADEPQSALAPRTAMEEIVAGVWAALLGRSTVSSRDNFFELGGHSLLAMQVVSRLREALRREVPVRMLFEAPVLADLAQRLESMLAGHSATPPPLVPVARGADLPLSFAQQRLWFLEQFEPGGFVYNVPVLMRLEGTLDVAALERSVAEILRRHEVLRTTFVEQTGKPVQCIAPELPFSLAVESLEALPEAVRTGTANQRAIEESRHPFDLAQGPLVRAKLFRIAPEHHQLLLVMHHIVCDGWSLTVLMRELEALYSAFSRGEEPTLPALPVQYADYATWQREWLQGEALEAQLNYWRQRLEGVPDVLELPVDRPRPPVQSYNGTLLTLQLPEEISDAIQQMERTESVTPFMVLLAAFYTFLLRYTGQSDIVVGSPISGRNRREVEGLIGFFVNTLALRVEAPGDISFRELLGRVREACLGAYAHQELPFEQLVDAVYAGRDLSRMPLFQVMFVLQDAPAALEMPALSVEMLDLHPGMAKFDLTLFTRKTSGGWVCFWEYNTDLFDESTVSRMAAHYVRLLEGALMQPELRLREVPLLSPQERRQVLVEWNDTRTAYPRDACVHELFEEQVARTPEAIAAEYGDRQLTYRELNFRANQVARHLRRLGVTAGARVGLCASGSLEMVAGTLGILKAGAAYVPLDPTYPRERLALMVKDTDVPIVLVQPELATPDLVAHLTATGAKPVVLEPSGRTFAEESGENLGERALPQALAYVMYTSGSTGEPRGVCIPHRAIIRLVCNNNYLRLTESDRVAQLSNISFDATTWELWGALLNGARLVGVPKDVALSPTVLEGFLRERQVSAMFVVTALFRQIVAERPEAFSSVAQVMTGGEALEWRWAKRVRQQGGLKRLINCYGPTESTTFTTWYEVEHLPEQATSVPIGTPVSNTEVYVLDEWREPVPVGVVGELYVGGDGLALEYLNRPELTTERFVPNPFSQTPGARLYRTGDLVKYLPDGNIQFVGRRDTQVKVRGFRVELGEVEAALAKHPEVNEQVVTASDNGLGGKRLVAYVVPREPQSFDAAGLRAFLRQTLPEYMLPSMFVPLRALPLTPNGKVDRAALPEPDTQADEQENDFAPRTAMEEIVAGVWAALLGRSTVSSRDNFFELGGHSLLAMQVVSRLREALRREVPVRMLFEAPVLADLAQRLESMLAGHSATPPPLVPVARGADLPLSFAQQRLWFLEQFEPGGFAYNVPYAMRLTGELDALALQRSLGELVNRHEALRTTFAEVEGVPVQRVAPEMALAITTESLEELPDDKRIDAVRQRVEEEARRPFDLERGPLIRANLWRLAPDDHVLLLVMHHIVCDIWSLTVLTRELEALYSAFSRGEEPALPALPVQYADYALWQREWLKGEALEAQLNWWKERLAGAPPTLDLPVDRPRPPAQTFRGAHIELPLSATLSAAIRRLSRQEGVTPFMTFLAAFQALLVRYTGQSDVVVGSPILGRNHIEVEGLIGCFLNTLALRVEIPDDASFRNLLDRVREVCLGAYAHQDLPYEQLVEALQPVRDMARTPLFQVMFAHQVAIPALELSGLSMDVFAFEPGMAKFDLTLFVRETADGLLSVWEYNSDLFDEATIARMAAYYSRLLAEAVAHPEQPLSELPLLSEDERRRVLVEWNATAVPYPPARTVHALFEASAKRAPQAVAVRFGNEHWTYGELNQRANQLAHYLRARGVAPDVPVGLCVRRSLDLVVGVLGILKAGGAYVPLDPAYPRERLALMLESSGAQLLLTQRALLETLPTRSATPLLLDSDESDWANGSASTPHPISGPDSLAYIIYTSGSTGVPKGIAMPHRPLNNLIRWQVGHSPQPRARTLQFAALSFDVSFQEMFSTWTAGGELVLVSEETRRDAGALLDLLERDRIERLFLPLVALQHLAEVADQEKRVPRHLKELITGGEQLKISPALRRFIKRLGGCVLQNHYGPSETHVATAFTLSGDPDTWPDVPPVGRPISNTSVHLLDRHLQPVPIGVPGEIYIGGAGVARGYHRRPDLTEERFIPDPIGVMPGGRLYRTGDFARYLPDGNIEFLGRRDTQVKIRGYRIEPTEVEAVLAHHPDVRDCVVDARDDASGQKRLVAYVTGEVPEASELREFLKARLPEYMVPSAFVRLDALPLTPSGKVARKALPPPEEHARERHSVVGPRNALELRLVRIWEDVLGIHPIGVLDNFFELGGHSLLAIRLLARIRGSMGRNLPVAALFQHATVESLARILRQDAGSWSPLVELRGGSAKRPFFCVHPVGGTVVSYVELARLLGSEQPFYGLQSPGLEEEQAPLDSIESMAELYIEAVRTVQPHGPYRLGGWSMGGCIAFEMARRLRQAGEQVELLVLIDSFARLFTEEQAVPDAKEAARLAALFYQDLLRAAGQASPLSEDALSDMEPDQMLAALEEAGRSAASALGIGLQPLQALRRVFEVNLRAVWNYKPRAYEGSLVSFEAASSPQDRGWAEFASGGVTIHRLDGDHYSILRRPCVEALAAQLRTYLDRPLPPDPPGRSRNALPTGAPREPHAA